MPIDSDQGTGDLGGPEVPSDREGVAAPSDGEAVSAPSGRFVPVRLDKFLILSICTFGVYQLVWFYRQWRWVRDHEGSRIWPLARTIFLPLWCFALLQRIGFGWAAAFGLTGAVILSYGLASLPDSYWLMGTALAQLPLIPAVVRVNRMSPRGAPRVPSADWRGRDSVAIVFAGLVAGLIWMDSVGPPTMVVPAERVRAEYMEYLTDTGLLAEGETLLYFYSNGFFSIEGDGVFASDWGVTSYWIDPVSEELAVAFIRYEEIDAIEVNEGAGWWDPTMVRIIASDGNAFVFPLPTEEGGDQAFLDEVERRRREAEPSRQDIA